MTTLEARRLNRLVRIGGVNSEMDQNKYLYICAPVTGRRWTGYWKRGERKGSHGMNCPSLVINGMATMRHVHRLTSIIAARDKYGEWVVQPAGGGGCG